MTNQHKPRTTSGPALPTCPLYGWVIWSGAACFYFGVVVPPTPFSGGAAFSARSLEWCCFPSSVFGSGAAFHCIVWCDAAVSLILVLVLLSSSSLCGWCCPSPPPVGGAVPLWRWGGEVPLAVLLSFWWWCFFPIACPLLAVLSYCWSAPSPNTIRCDQARSSSHPMYQSSKTHLRNNLVDMLFTIELKSILAASSAPDHLRGWLLEARELESVEDITCSAKRGEEGESNFVHVISLVVRSVREGLNCTKVWSAYDKEANLRTGALHKSEESPKDKHVRIDLQSNCSTQTLIRSSTQCLMVPALCGRRYCDAC